jgi:glutamate carboxypeptidase
MMAPMDVLRLFGALPGRTLEMLRRLIEMESHSADKPAVDRLAEFLAREFKARGSEVEILRSATSGNGLKAIWHGGGSSESVMFLGHLDTVWPPGTISRRPFAVRDGKAFGPGVFDMKCGILLCLLICAAFNEGRMKANGDVIFFFTPDEETGTHAGRPSLEAAASECLAVLCLEPPLPGGKAKTFRKGVGSITIRVAGIAAHAGVDPEKGANAIVELSRQIARVQRMIRSENGNTVNVGTIHGGTAANVVPHRAEAEVDFRFSSGRAGRRLEKRILQLRPYDSRCRLEISGGINRPPLERTPEVVSLYRRAKAIASSLGMKLGEGETGGGSDGSFTAALGIPTLDGLGVAGDGAHAEHEHILIADIPRRAALLSLLGQELLR